MRAALRVVILGGVLASACPARADDALNVLIGPVFGLRVGGHPGPRAVVGVEGGVGAGPERVNAGFEYRDGKLFGYGELDPWLWLGMSLGVGVDSDGEEHVVLGLWEGVPLRLADCSEPPGSWSRAVTVSAGWRYTGVHELYVAFKAGASQRFCFDE